MSDRAHIVEIESIVLAGVNTWHNRLLPALIEAQVLRALAETSMPQNTAGRDIGTRVAKETACSVVQAVHGKEGS